MRSVRTVPLAGGASYTLSDTETVIDTYVDGFNQPWLVVLTSVNPVAPSFHSTAGPFYGE